jgi:hypothetical protein
VADREQPTDARVEVRRRSVGHGVDDVDQRGEGEPVGGVVEQRRAQRRGAARRDRPHGGRQGAEPRSVAGAERDQCAHQHVVPGGREARAQPDQASYGVAGGVVVAGGGLVHPGREPGP